MMEIKDSKDSNLLKLDKATQLLAEVRSIDDATELIDLAEAARVYAKQVKLGLEAQNHAAEIKLRAQRKAGEILDSMEKAKPRGSNQYQDRLHAETDPPTYADLDIDKRDAHVSRLRMQVDNGKLERLGLDAISLEKTLVDVFEEVEA